MRLSLVIAIMGAVIVAVAVLLFLLGSPASSLGVVVNEALAQLNRSESLSLAPGANISFAFPQPVIILVNSSKPPKIIPESLRAIAQGLITAVAAPPNTTVYIVNNYSEPIYVKYAVVTISRSLSNAVFFALISLGLGFVGFVVLVIGVVLYALKK